MIIPSFTILPPLVEYEISALLNNQEWRIINPHLYYQSNLTYPITELTH